MPGFYPGGKRAGSRADRPGIRHPVPPQRLLLSRPVLFMAALLLLAMAALPLAQHRQPTRTLSETYRQQLARDNLSVLRIALARLHADCGRYPRTEEGLVSLMHPAELPGWNGPYLIELKPDPWQRRFEYESDGYHYRLFSAGPDGIPGTGDDVELTRPRP